MPMVYSGRVPHDVRIVTIVGFFVRMETRIGGSAMTNTLYLIIIGVQKRVIRSKPIFIRAIYGAFLPAFFPADKHIQTHLN
jgi:hypothetical protein